MQGGGKTGSSTIDYIMIFKKTLKLKNTTYITFLDVTQAYDKAWADALISVLYKQGIQNKLKAKVRTKHEETRTIKIRDSIRQGGVLSVTLYATLMDEIAKEINNKNLGIKTGDDRNVGCLLWTDDVVLIADSQKEMQKCWISQGKLQTDTTSNSERKKAR